MHLQNKPFATFYFEFIYLNMKTGFTHKNIESSPELEYIFILW